MEVKEYRRWEEIRSDLKKGREVYMRYELNVENFIKQFNMTIEHVGDEIETIELDIENVKDIKGMIFGDFTLSIIPKSKLNLTPFDLFTWLSSKMNHEKDGETIVYMRLLMMENCHIEKDGDYFIPIVYVDREAYTETEYHIITNYLEYLGLETEDLEK